MEKVYVVIAKDENNEDRIFIGNDHCFPHYFGLLNWYGISHAQFYSSKISANYMIEQIKILSKLGYCGDIIRDTLEPKLITIEGIKVREDNYECE